MCIRDRAGVDEALVARASHHLVGLEQFFQVCLKDAGASNSQAEELAAMLMLLNEGVRVSSRRRLPQAQLQKPIDASFQLIRRAMV